MTPTEKKIIKTALLLIGTITAISLLLSLLDVITFNTALKTITTTTIIIAMIGLFINSTDNLEDQPPK